MNRRHNAVQAVESIENAAKTGINITITKTNSTDTLKLSFVADLDTSNAVLNMTQTVKGLHSGGGWGLFLFEAAYHDKIND